jgi:signal peptidase I
MVMVAARLGSAPRSTRLRYAVRWHASRGVRLAITALLLTAAAAALAPVVLVALGYQPTMVHTDGMAPAMADGDVVINETQYPDGIAAGDVITFSDAARAGETFTERVVTVAHYGEAYAFSTKSDAEETTHQWSVPEQERVTRVAFHVPVLRQPVAMAGTLAGRPLLLVGAAAALLALLGLRRATS